MIFFLLLSSIPIFNACVKQQTLGTATVTK
jgi:hypothetical protein